ncbi:MAG: TonB-dependent receptor [Chlorobi bacterium]|nr:TonB-dependent receptor [Chlorobiota bacterium]
MRVSVFYRLIIFSFLLLPSLAFAQTARVEGFVTDSSNSNVVDLANIAILGEKGGTTSDPNGFFSLKVPAERDFILAISFVGYEDKHISFKLEDGELRRVKVVLKPMTTNLPGFEVRDERLRTESLVRLDPKNASIAPSISGGLEAIIVTLPGVSSNNEMSSQYSVRGGNFDENLIYVNDIEIYRPFLVTSGEQEGLSFINPALVSSVLFSAGGFGAEYGDKMSSVLDVKYKSPTEFGGSFAISLLGAELALEGTNKKKNFTYLLGGRYKTNQYILNNLETQGNYKPRFIDVQALLTHKLSEKWDLSLLAYYSENKYKVVPTTRETDFGTFQQAYRFKVYFDGNEIDDYEMGQGALTLRFAPNKITSLKLIASAFTTNESETYDVQGQYWIGQLENSLGSDEFGDVVQQQGVGTFLQHARNRFRASVISLQHKGSRAGEKTFLEWGLKYDHQIIDDNIREWEMIDSAGYSLPHPVDQPGNPNPDRPDFGINYFAKGNNILSINRFSAFVSNQWQLDLKNKDQITVTAGLRSYFWDYNNEFLLMPRFNIAFKPYKKQNVVFRFSTGLYYQPPFYRELRNFDGSLNPDIKSQKSIHFIFGSDYRFRAWNRPFIFTTELYYKHLDNLIPYVVDNVRIRYYADQLAKGYAAGIDLKVYGEFVKGVDSWISMSVMKTQEDIYGDYYYNYYNEAGELIRPGVSVDNIVSDSLRVEPGYIDRPSDQRVNFSVFFQDYIPGQPYVKMHLRLVYGTGLSFGPPKSERYQQTLRMPDYRRVDIGFSYAFINESSSMGPKNPLRNVKGMTVSLEVFNLLQIYNTISYVWIKDIDNRQYAVPNYLTPRLVNLKLTASF